MEPPARGRAARHDDQQDDEAGQDSAEDPGSAGRRLWRLRSAGLHLGERPGARRNPPRRPRELAPVPRLPPPSHLQTAPIVPNTRCKKLYLEPRIGAWNRLFPVPGPEI